MIPLGRLFRMMYWSLRKDWRVWPHLLAVLRGWIANLVRLRLARAFGRATLAIGLVEHLGDIVAAEPISRLARRQHPGSRIAWVTRKPYASVPAAFQAVDAVIPVTCLTEWLLLRASGLEPAWDLHINQRYCPRCQVPVHKYGAAGGIDSANYYRSGNLLAVQCLSAGLPVLTTAPELRIDPAAADAVARLSLPSRLVVIHCASNEASRDWPRANWTALLDQVLRESSLSVAEIGLHPTVITEDSSRERSLCGKLTIDQTTAVLSRATLFIGIDSGPAHLANALGVPAVILLGGYKGFVGYMPYSGGYADGTRADIVRTDGPMDTLPVAAVVQAVRSRLS